MTRGRVLVAEDEVDLAWVEQFNLETEGYEVKVAPEGRAALEALESFEPDVLILDVMLPHLDGWTVLQEVQELPHDRRPKVILVSAVAGMAEKARGAELGAWSYLSKPFDMDELLRLVEEAMAA